MRESAPGYPQLICAMSLSEHNGSGVAEAQYYLKDKPVCQSTEIEKSDVECGSGTKAEMSLYTNAREGVCFSFVLLMTSYFDSNQTQKRWKRVLRELAKILHVYQMNRYFGEAWRYIQHWLKFDLIFLMQTNHTFSFKMIVV